MRVVEVKGTHLKIGEQLGEACKEIAMKLREQFLSYWECSAANASLHGSKFLPYAEVFYPPYMQELRGYARAIDVPFEEVFAWFCYDPPAPKGCTDLVFNQRATADGHVYMVHNEDYNVEEEDFAVMVKMRPDDAPAFMAMAYGGIWFNGGVNECGIGLAGTGVTHTDSRVGIPGDCSFRKVLSARTIGEAMEFSTPRGRSFSYCNIICDEAGEMYAMEGSATDFAAIHGREFLVHSNHYVHPKMEKYDAAFINEDDRSPGSYSDSIVRYNRATNLALDNKWGITTDGMRINIEGIKAITRDHVNRPWSLCRHADESLPPEKQSKTVFSEIIDVTDRTIRVCKGNPCEGEYELHKL